MNWLKNAGQWILNLLKPIGKSIAGVIIQQEGDRLQANIKIAISLRGPKAIDAEVDKWQDRLIGAIKTIKFLPEAWKAGAEQIIQSHGDQLQEALKQSLEKGGLPAIDVVFDSSQAMLLARINSL